MPHARNASIRLGLGAELLPCGCVIGLYETYSGKVLPIVDFHEPRCGDAAHQKDQVLALVRPGDRIHDPID